MKNFKSKFLSAIVLAVLVLGLLPITALAASPGDVVIGNNYTLDSDEVLNDDLLIMGGNVDLMPGSTVNGTVFLLGGSLDAAGTINGDVIVLGGTVTLADTFVLHGDLITAGTSVNRDAAAQVFGQTFSGENNPFLILPGGVQLPSFTPTYDPLMRVGGFFIRLLLWALVAMVVVMFIPTHLSRTSQTVMTQPLISGGLGCLTLIIAPIVLIFLAITICLIPVSVVGIILLVLAWAYGLIAIGFEFGKRLSMMFKREWHPAITAGIGMLILMIVLSGLETFVPCIGWIPKALVGFVGLGAVLLTRFGVKPYPPSADIPGPSPEETLPESAVS